jgi:hypothetical protein
MTRFHLALITVALLAAPGSSHAQSGSAPVAPTEAAQFDFLVGQWDIEVTPKVNGLAAMIHGTPHLLGSWKAWRAFDGFGVDDEVRVVDGGGNPVTLSRALRVYDAKAHRWAVETLDVYAARFSAATAQWQGGEMRGSSSGSMPDGKAFLSRTRFYEISPDHFKMSQDRSYDNGASWDEGAITISAKRVAAKAQR